MVLRMAGVTSKNYRSILNKFENMQAVSRASLEDLNAALGNSAQAQQLFDFFRTTAKPELDAEKRPNKPSKRGGKRRR
nr:hypothetical protein BaRGS_017004 [Batillaria attramentaria]